VKLSASFWFSTIDEHPQLISIHDVPEGISPAGLTVLLELKVVQGVNAASSKCMPNVLFDQKMGVLVLCRIRIFNGRRYFGTKTIKRVNELGPLLQIDTIVEGKFL
jgi:hypothetical protein